eukprot:PhM_4_TR11562/c0_g1_i1/m.85592
MTRKKRGHIQNSFRYSTTSHLGDHQLVPGLGPRAGVQRRDLETNVRELGEHLARRHARAAHDDQALPTLTTTAVQLLDLVARRVAEEEALGAGNVARQGVWEDGLADRVEARGGTRVHERRLLVALGHGAVEVRDGEAALLPRGGHVGGRCGRGLLGRGLAFLFGAGPRREAVCQDADVVQADSRQHPPRARGTESALHVVVAHNQSVGVREAPRRRPRHELGQIGQRGGRALLARGAGQHLAAGHGDSAWETGRGVLGGEVRGVADLHAAVQEADLACLELLRRLHVVSRDEHLTGHS